MIFDPATASTAGAAFAALLAAIVLAVLGQLAIAGDHDPAKYKHAQSGHKYSKSLSLGLPILALLLATTYMFVLVSGLPALPAQAMLAKAPPAIALLRGNAFLFIVCGSALAVSAAGVIVVVGLVVSESGTRSGFVRGVAHGTLAWGVIADAVFPLYGYNDIARHSAGARQSGHSPQGWP